MGHADNLRAGRYVVAARARPARLAARCVADRADDRRGDRRPIDAGAGRARVQAVSSCLATVCGQAICASPRRGPIGRSISIRSPGTTPTSPATADSPSMACSGSETQVWSDSPMAGRLPGSGAVRPTSGRASSSSPVPPRLSNRRHAAVAGSARIPATAAARTRHRCVAWAGTRCGDGQARRRRGRATCQQHARAGSARDPGRHRRQGFHAWFEDRDQRRWRICVRRYQARHPRLIRLTPLVFWRMQHSVVRGNCSRAGSEIGDIKVGLQRGGIIRGRLRDTEEADRSPAPA